MRKPLLHESNSLERGGEGEGGSRDDGRSTHHRDPPLVNGVGGALDGGDDVREHYEEEEQTEQYSERFNRAYDTLDNRRGRMALTLLWAIALLVGALNAYGFIENSSDMVTAPKGTRVYRDNQFFDSKFELASHTANLVIYFGSVDRVGLVTCPQDDCRRGRRCRGENPTVARFFEEFSSALFDKYGSDITSYSSYYNLSGTSFDRAKCEFASHNGTATFALFTYPIDLPKLRKHAIFASVSDLMKSLNPDPELYRIGYTCADAIAKEGSDESEKQLFTVDLFTMPIALGLFAMMVRSFRLLGICMLNAMMTVVISFGLISLLIQAIDVRPLTVSVTMSEALALSMSIDYSLFLSRRFRDEIKNGRTPEDALKITVRQAGEVVLLSCLTFITVFVGFLFLRSEDLQSFGMVCIVTLATAITVNVSMHFILIGAFPSFFARFSFPTEVVKDLDFGRTVTGKRRHHRGPRYSGNYFRFLRRVTTYPYNILFIVGVYALILPLAFQVLRIKYNQDPMHIAPRNSQSTATFRDLKENFPGGLMAPMNVVFMTRPGVPVLSHEHFTELHTLVDKISLETGVDEKYVRGPAVLEGRRVSLELAKELLDPHSPLCRVERDLCSLYAYTWEMSVNGKGGDTSVTVISPPLDVFSNEGMDYVDAAYRAIDDYLDARKQKEASDEVRVALCGNELDLLGDMRLAYDSLPMLLIFTMVTIFTLLGIGFQSAFIWIRLSLTVFIPLCGVFGTAVEVFQDGALEWTHIRSFEQDASGFFWFIPVVCLLQSIGLVLDYDTFTVHRVLEHRTDGYTMQAAIVKGMWEVNSTIVVAGLIMSSVFGGLLVSTQAAVDQFGYLLCLGVLFDTFVVQSCLMPAIMSVGDGAALWPRKVPREGLIGLDDVEFS